MCAFTGWGGTSEFLDENFRNLCYVVKEVEVSSESLVENDQDVVW